jgi:hypothetical protein
MEKTIPITPMVMPRLPAEEAKPLICVLDDNAVSCKYTHGSISFGSAPAKL